MFVGNKYERTYILNCYGNDLVYRYYSVNYYITKFPTLNLIILSWLNGYSFEVIIINEYLKLQFKMLVHGGLYCSFRWTLELFGSNYSIVVIALSPIVSNSDIDCM